MEEITSMPDGINSIVNLNENSGGGFATGIDYIGENTGYDAPPVAIIILSK